ncbi:MAG: hypothetical protein FWB91_06325 [Defluviitaleaceae bacterium]|nr:hypothetical protein [Defluviitaleaceae bacterium]
MDANDLPTKRNLLQAKHNLSLARKGHNLLDKRHKALLHELSEAKNKVHILRKKLHSDIITAYQILAIAQIELGQENVASLWKIFFPVGGYDLSETAASLDEAFCVWREVLTKIQELADAEAKIRRLAALIRRTRKRAAALRNVTIPKYEARIKYISEQLEERERDEMVRLKTAKKSRETL